jgi:hypothetical protein
VQRDSLIANYPHVVFDLSKEFRESPRVHVWRSMFSYFLWVLWLLK